MYNMSYKTEELVSSSVVARNFGAYLSKISSNELEKIAVLKNNKIQAVIVSPEMYQQFEDFLEDMEIINNRDKLQKEMQESSASGLSDLVI